MKKLISILLLLCMLLSLSVINTAADNTITIIVDTKAVDCSLYGQEPVIVEGRTLVPLRAVFEALGATVAWDDQTKTITSTKGAMVVTLQVGSTTLSVNGAVKMLDVPAQIMNGRTMVPVRAVAEAFSCKVEWDGATRTVNVTTPSLLFTDQEKFYAAKKACEELWAYTKAGDFVAVAKYYPADSVYAYATSMADIVNLGITNGQSLDGLNLSDEQRARINAGGLKVATAFIENTEYVFIGARVEGDRVLVSYNLIIPNITELDVADYIAADEIQSMYLKVFMESGYSINMTEAEKEILNTELTVRVYETLFDRIAANMATMEKGRAVSSMDLEYIDGSWKVVAEHEAPYKKMADYVQ